jgi:hypothetical protein
MKVMELLSRKCISSVEVTLYHSVSFASLSRPFEGNRVSVNLLVISWHLTVNEYRRWMGHQSNGLYGNKIGPQGCIVSDRTPTSGQNL